MKGDEFLKANANPRTFMINKRKQMGLTQRVFGQNLGLSQNYVSEVESGVRRPSGPVAYKLAKFMGVPMEKFFEDDSHEDEEDCETRNLTA